MKFKVQTLAVLLALAATACESSVYSVTQDRLYSPARAHYAAGAKSLNTIIRGNPFDSPQDLVNGLIIDEMRRGMRGVDTALRRRPIFTIDAAGDAAGDYLVAVALNPEPGADPASLCADPRGVAVSQAAAPAGRIEARMATQAWSMAPSATWTKPAIVASFAAWTSTGGGSTDTAPAPRAPYLR